MIIPIPLRAKNEAEFPTLKKIDKEIIAYAVLFGTDNQTAYLRFHPEYLDSTTGRINAAGKQDAKFFWNYGKNKEYRLSYEATVEEFLDGRKKEAKGEAAFNIDDSRKDKALKSLLNQAMSMVERGADLDADTLKTVTEIFRKLNILKEEVEQVEMPRRYLPESCNSCEYKKFIDAHVASGAITEESDESIIDNADEQDN